MSDVLTIAMKRRERLQAEVAKLDQFLKFAVQLTDLESKAEIPLTPAASVPEPKSHVPEADDEHDADEAEEVAAAPSAPKHDVVARASLFRRLNGDGELRKAVG